MKNSKTGGEIFATVVDNQEYFYTLKYLAFDMELVIEIPKRPINSHLKDGDEVTLELNMFATEGV